MATLSPGQQVIRLIPSTTGRQIQPNTLGVIGGLDPGSHDNHPQNWPMYGYMPVQWVNGLWSSMAIMDKGYSWDFYPIETTTNTEETQNDTNQNSVNIYK